MTGRRLCWTAWATAAVLTGGCATTSAPDGRMNDGEDWAESEELEQVLEKIESSEVNGASNHGPGTRIGPHDLLEIVVFDAPELSRSVRVSSEGEVALPLLGVVAAAGSTTRELARAIEARLGERYMRDPHVAVQLTETRPRSVYVLGEVNRPGSFEFDGRDRTTVLQAVAMGGGVSPVAAKNRAVLIRTSGPGERAHIPIDLDRALNGSAADEPMLPNDILFVPRSTPRSVIRGVFGAITRIITFRGIF